MCKEKVEILVKKGILMDNNTVDFTLGGFFLSFIEKKNKNSFTSKTFQLVPLSCTLFSLYLLFLGELSSNELSQ